MLYSSPHVTPHSFIRRPAALLRLLAFALLLASGASGAHAQSARSAGDAPGAAGDVRSVVLRPAGASQRAVPGRAAVDTTTAKQRFASSSLDGRLMLSIYEIEAPAFAAWMRAADASSYPVFFGGPVLATAGVGFARGGEDFADAYRLVVSQATTVAVVSALKSVVARPRPYYALSDIDSRSRRLGIEPSPSDRFSFPSGHAGTAATLAASWSLSHPRWYVIAPSAAWASSVMLSRVWLGVHYPADALAGALLGTGIAFGVHLLGDAITPNFLERQRDADPAAAAATSAPPMLRLRVPLP